MKYGIVEENKPPEFKEKWKLSVDKDLTSLKFEMSLLKHQMKESVNRLERVICGFPEPRLLSKGTKEQKCGTRKVQFRATFVQDDAKYMMLQSVSGMAEYQDWSLEELRLQDYTFSTQHPNQVSNFGLKGAVWGTWIKNYQPTILPESKTITIYTRMQCITCQKQYEKKSFEELRHEDYVLKKDQTYKQLYEYNVQQRRTRMQNILWMENYKRQNNNNGPFLFGVAKTDVSQEPNQAMDTDPEDHQIKSWIDFGPTKSNLPTSKFWNISPRPATTFNFQFGNSVTQPETTQSKCLGDDVPSCGTSNSSSPFNHKSWNMKSLGDGIPFFGTNNSSSPFNQKPWNINSLGDGILSSGTSDSSSPFDPKAWNTSGRPASANFRSDKSKIIGSGPSRSEELISQVLSTVNKIDTQLSEVSSRLSVMDSRLSAINMFVSMKQLNKKWEGLEPRLSDLDTTGVDMMLPEDKKNMRIDPAGDNLSLPSPKVPVSHSTVLPCCETKESFKNTSLANCSPELNNSFSRSSNESQMKLCISESKESKLDAPSLQTNEKTLHLVADGFDCNGLKNVSSPETPNLEGRGTNIEVNITLDKDSDMTNTNRDSPVANTLNKDSDMTNTNRDSPVANTLNKDSDMTNTDRDSPVANTLNKDSDMTNTDRDSPVANTLNKDSNMTNTDRVSPVANTLNKDSSMADNLNTSNPLRAEKSEKVKEDVDKGVSFSFKEPCTNENESTHDNADELGSDEENGFVIIHKESPSDYPEDVSNEIGQCTDEPIEYTELNMCNDITEYLEVNLGKEKGEVYKFGFKAKVDLSSGSADRPDGEAGPARGEDKTGACSSPRDDSFGTFQNNLTDSHFWENKQSSPLLSRSERPNKFRFKFKFSSNPPPEKTNMCYSEIRRRAEIHKFLDKP